VRTDIVSVGSFVPFDFHALWWCEVHRNHDTESSFFLPSRLSCKSMPLLPGKPDDVLARLPRCLGGEYPGMLASASGRSRLPWTG
jgi:hypothetical protein